MKFTSSAISAINNFSQQLYIHSQCSYALEYKYTVDIDNLMKFYFDFFSCLHFII